MNEFDSYSSEPWSWDEMVEEFKSHGGTISNVEQRHGEYGMGLFPVDPGQPVDILVPENLLVPVKWVKAVGSDLEIIEESGIDPRYREFFTRYQRSFSWGLEGLEFGMNWGRNINAISEQLRQVLVKKIGITIPSDGVNEEYALQRYTKSRAFNYMGERVIMPVMELLNHSSGAKTYEESNGIRVSGKFTDEVLVEYNRVDSLTKFVAYGFVSQEQNVFCWPGLYRYFGLNLKVDGHVNTVQGDEGILCILPVIEKAPDRITASHLVLGDVTRPRVPQSIFRKILPQLSSDQADEFFQIIVNTNINFIVDLLRLVDGEENPLLCDLRKVCLLQLEGLASSYGVRDLSTLPPSP